jgi:hypothetical protein
MEQRTKLNQLIMNNEPMKAWFHLHQNIYKPFHIRNKVIRKVKTILYCQHLIKLITHCFYCCYTLEKNNEKNIGIEKAIEFGKRNEKLINEKSMRKSMKNILTFHEICSLLYLTPSFNNLSINVNNDQSNQNNENKLIKKVSGLEMRQSISNRINELLVNDFHFTKKRKKLKIEQGMNTFSCIELWLKQLILCYQTQQLPQHLII